jgi:hypothetical protein
MPTIFKIILIVMFAWAGAVSVFTGEIILRSGPAGSGSIPRLFGACLLLAAATFTLQVAGLVPESYQTFSSIAIGGSLVVAIVLVWFA